MFSITINVQFFLEYNKVGDVRLTLFNSRELGEQTSLAPDLANLVTKYTFRANHRFGMVYFQADLKNGAALKMTIIPQFAL